jgi:hypothetical protein
MGWAGGVGWGLGSWTWAGGIALFNHCLSSSWRLLSVCMHSLACMPVPECLEACTACTHACRHACMSLCQSICVCSCPVGVQVSDCGPVSFSDCQCIPPSHCRSTPDPTVTVCGVVLSSLLPTPSWPLSFRPQHLTVPPVSSAHVKPVPSPAPQANMAVATAGGIVFVCGWGRGSSALWG